MPIVEARRLSAVGGCASGFIQATGYRLQASAALGVAMLVVACGSPDSMQAARASSMTGTGGALDAQSMLFGSGGVVGEGGATTAMGGALLGAGGSTGGAAGTSGAANGGVGGSASGGTGATSTGDDGGSVDGGVLDAGSGSGGASHGSGGKAGGDAGAAGKGSGGSDGGSTVAKCTSDGECSAPTRFCDVAKGACVACLSNNHCPAGQTCVPSSHTCEYACKTSGDCSDPLPYCDMKTQKCVGCLGDANCTSGAKNICDPSTHACVGCLTSSDCACALPLQLPCCSQSKTCTCSLLVCP